MDEPSFAAETRNAIAAALTYLIDVDGGPTEEQQTVLNAFKVYWLRSDETRCHPSTVLTPADVPRTLESTYGRRIFLQMAIMLELCRHPPCDAQLQRLEEYSLALDFNGPQLQAVRDLAQKSAEEATAIFLRVYQRSMPELTEPQFRAFSDVPPANSVLWEQLDRLQDMPKGSLGREFFEFYERNDLAFPGVDTPNPGYYVAHDMNHVIAGYEPTGPGEIALGALKLMMNNSEANWMGSMVNFLIHEVGLFKHGDKLQFVPYGKGGEPYHGIDGRRGALSIEGGPELLAEAFSRGAECTADFAQLDHLACAARPLIDIRREYNVKPLFVSMRTEQSDRLWPSEFTPINRKA